MYLVQEWIYRRTPMPVEKHEISFDDIEEADRAYVDMENHLKTVATKESLCPSFVRMFKMKKSLLTSDGIGVDRCLRITYVPKIIC